MINISDLQKRFYLNVEGYICRFTDNAIVTSNNIYIRLHKMSIKKAVLSLSLGYIPASTWGYYGNADKNNNNINNLRISKFSTDECYLHECKEYVYFNTKYGVCKLRKDRFSSGDRRPLINRAVNKTEFIKAYLKDTFDGLGFTYDKVVYKGVNNKITITCIKYGDFDTLLGNFISGKGHPDGRGEKIRDKRSIKYCDYIDKLKDIHNDKYQYPDYDEKYVNSRSKITAVCSIHGKFKITAIDHYSGNGCEKCGRESLSRINKENPTGWSHSNWKIAAEKSKRFDSYKVYFLECYSKDKTEKFYKIGRTFLSIKDRFVGKHNLPYEFNILYYIELPEAKDICNLETKYKNIHKHLKYIPKIHFNGKNECFSKLIYI